MSLVNVCLDGELELHTYNKSPYDYGSKNYDSDEEDMKYHDIHNLAERKKRLEALQ